MGKAEGATAGGASEGAGGIEPFGGVRSVGDGLLPKPPGLRAFPVAPLNSRFSWASGQLQTEHPEVPGPMPGPARLLSI